MHMHMHVHMYMYARAHAHAVYRCMRVLCARMCTIDTCTTLYYPTRLNEVQTWLLDEDACKTEWQTLLDLRARHGHAQ